MYLFAADNVQQRFEGRQRHRQRRKNGRVIQEEEILVGSEMRMISQWISSWGVVPLPLRRAYRAATTKLARKNIA
jgi:hypothetical protein